MDWDELDKKYGGGKAAAPSSFDELDKKYSAPSKSVSMPVPEKAEPVTDFSGNLRFGSFDTGIPLPQSVNKGLAQIGSGMADWVLAGNQMMARDPARVAEMQDLAADKRARDKALNTGIIGTVNNLAGKIAPAMGMPAAGFVGGTLGGAAIGASEPTVEGESRTANTLLGAAGGAALPTAGAVTRAVLAPKGAAKDLAEKAVQYGIPLGAADLAQNRFVSAARSVLNDIPGVGSIGRAQDAAKQEAFNRAVGKQIGADAPALTPDVMASAKGKIAGKLDRVWSNNALTVDQGLAADFARVGQRAQMLTPEQQRTVTQWASKLAQGGQGNAIPGAYANNWQSELRRAVEGEKGLAKDVLNDLRHSVIRAFNRGVSPEDAAALTAARKQYGTYKTLEPLMAKGEVGVAGRSAGDVPAGLLPQAVFQNGGTQEMKDLAAIGSRYLADRVGRTGGDVRALIQNGSIGGGIAAGVTGFGPQAALTGLGAAGANWALGSPTLAKKLLDPKKTRGLLDMEPSAMTLEAMQRAALLAPPGLLTTGLLGQ